MRIKNLVLLIFFAESLVSFAQDCKTTGNKQNGSYIEYYSNCTKKLECFYKNGQYDSTYTEWTEKGKLKIKGQYDNGKKEGIWKHEYATINNGYMPSSNYHYVEYTYQDGKLKKAYEYVSSSDSLTPKRGEQFVTYGKDTVTRSLGYFENGKLNHEDSTVSGRLNGLQRAWDKEGGLFREEFFDMGLPLRKNYYYLNYKTVKLYHKGTVQESSLKQYDLKDKLIYEEYYDKKGKVAKKKGVKQTGK